MKQLHRNWSLILALALILGVEAGAADQADEAAPAAVALATIKA
jgi:hypothetical protein